MDISECCIGKFIVNIKTDLDLEKINLRFIKPLEN
jgi:hypothetical protein